MRLALSALSLLLIGATSASAQAVAVTHSTICPGHFSARRQATPVTRWTLAREDKNTPGETSQAGRSGVHVSLDSSLKDVRQMEISVDYLPPGARFMLVQPDKASKAREQSKSFDLSASEANKQVDGDLLVGPVFSITRVRLLSVEYADGSSWKAPSDSACSVAPDGFLLVNAH